jgi:dimethylaniline monooxygenase (N-oxide forming)
MLDRISDAEPLKDSLNRRIDTCTFPSYISPTGDIEFTPDNRKDYERLKSHAVRATTIIYCTGYVPSINFLPSSYPSPSSATCRHIVVPQNPSVAFIGFVRPRVGSIGPLGEQQAMWYTALLLGRMRCLPTSAPHYTLRPAPPQGIGFSIEDHGIDYSAYMATLARDMGALPPLRTLWREYGPKTLLAYGFGASFVSFYRLTGPFSQEREMMKGVVEGELLDTVRKKGWIGNVLFGLVPMVCFWVVNGVVWVLERVRLMGKRKEKASSPLAVFAV